MARKTLGISTIKVLHSVASGCCYGFDIMDLTSLPSRASRVRNCHVGGSEEGAA
jgi:hypothetical protein